LQTSVHLFRLFEDGCLFFSSGYCRNDGVCIMSQAKISFLCFVGMFYMPFKFISEMTDGSSNRPCSSITERTNGISFDSALYIPKQIDITHFPFAVFYVFEDFVHPACTFTTWATLSATFVIIESGQRHSVSYHTLVFIKYNKPSRS